MTLGGVVFVTPALVWLAAAAPIAALALHAYDGARRRQLSRRLGELPLIRRVTSA